MKRNLIGRTGVAVATVSFGCSSIGNLIRKVEDADAWVVLDHAWARGIRYFEPHRIMAGACPRSVWATS